MMTPEDYLRENPTHMLRWVRYGNQTRVEWLEDNGVASSKHENIDWTGYTEPHVMIGPDFPESRKRVVEWGLDRIYPWGPSDDNPRHPELRRCLTAENGDKFAQYGKYIDAPVKPETELSRFLPDGCKWRMSEDGTEWYIELQESWLFPTHQVKTWNYLGLLHPSEGGGFQKHTPGDPMPCDKIMIDLIWDDELIHYEVPRGFSKLNSGGAICIGWRPHYKEQN
jgi:hypothetical protein